MILIYYAYDILKDSGLFCRCCDMLTAALPGHMMPRLAQSFMWALKSSSAGEEADFVSDCTWAQVTLRTIGDNLLRLWFRQISLAGTWANTCVFVSRLSAQQINSRIMTLYPQSLTIVLIPFPKQASRLVLFQMLYGASKHSSCLPFPWQKTW